jgi:hypothetical protein
MDSDHTEYPVTKASANIKDASLANSKDKVANADDSDKRLRDLADAAQADALEAVLVLDRETNVIQVSEILIETNRYLKSIPTFPLTPQSTHICSSVLGFSREVDRANWGGFRLYEHVKPLTSFYIKLKTSCTNLFGLVYEHPNWVTKTTCDAESEPWSWWAFLLIKQKDSLSRALIYFDPLPKTLNNRPRPGDLSTLQKHLWHIARNNGSLRRTNTRKQITFYYTGRPYSRAHDLSACLNWIRLFSLLDDELAGSTDPRLKQYTQITTA